MLKEYLQTNLIKAFQQSPLHTPLKAWSLVPFYAVISLAIGFGSGLFRFQLIAAEWAPLLLFTLFFLPSLLEEAFFRGVLIPRQTIAQSRRRIILTMTWSTLLFVLWHPLNAVTFNHAAIPVFLDPAFLLIVAMLGITCGYSYIVAKSIWVPVLIHWATVVVWVFFLNGRNLVLEL